MRALISILLPTTLVLSFFITPLTHAQKLGQFCSQQLVQDSTQVAIHILLEADRTGILRLEDLEAIIDSDLPFNPIPSSSIQTLHLSKLFAKVLKEGVDWLQIQEYASKTISKRRNQKDAQKVDQKRTYSPSDIQPLETMVSSTHKLDNIFEIEGPKGTLYYTLYPNLIQFVDAFGNPTEYFFEIDSPLGCPPVFFEIENQIYLAAIVTNPEMLRRSEYRIYEFKPNTRHSVKSFKLHTDGKTGLMSGNDPRKAIFVDQHKGLPVLIFQEPIDGWICFAFIDSSLDHHFRCIGLSGKFSGLSIFQDSTGTQGITWGSESWNAYRAEIPAFDYDKIANIEQPQIFFNESDNEDRPNHPTYSILSGRIEDLSRDVRDSDSIPVETDRGQWIVGSHHKMMSVYDIKKQTFETYREDKVEFLRDPIFYTIDQTDYVTFLAVDVDKDYPEGIFLSLWTFDLTHQKWTMRNQNLDIRVRERGKWNPKARRVLNPASFMIPDSRHYPTIQLVPDLPHVGLVRAVVRDDLGNSVVYLVKIDLSSGEPYTPLKVELTESSQPIFIPSEEKGVIGITGLSTGPSPEGKTFYYKINF